THSYRFSNVGVKPADKLPPTRIMEDIPGARHVVWHQGTPELVFGRFRKQLSESRDVSIQRYIAWLDKRYIIATQGVHELAVDVAGRAEEIVAEATITGATRQRGLPTSFTGALYLAIKELSETPGKKDVAQILKDYATANRVKHAPDMAQAWKEVVVELRQEAALATADEILLVRKATERYATIEDPAYRYYPTTRLEETITVGAGSPTYYFLEGVDRQAYPILEGNVSLQQYDEALEVANATHNGLVKTTADEDQLKRSAAHLNQVERARHDMLVLLRYINSDPTHAAIRYNTLLQNLFGVSHERRTHADVD
ncbi:MAG: hypothetical protein ACREGI_00100, partial [Candidatus Levyibacteriota bacterium]